MKLLSALIFLFLSTPLIAEDDQSIKYIGMYTNIRFTEEHFYVNELWLWQKGEVITGLFFSHGGLQGDGIHNPEINIITQAIGGKGKEFSFTANHYSFSGKYLSNGNQPSEEIVGVLKQQNEIIWGGIEGSNSITLKAGSNIHSINMPDGSLKTYSQWLAWVKTLGAK